MTPNIPSSARSTGTPATAALPPAPRSDLRHAIDAVWRTPEPICVPALIDAARLPDALREPVRTLAHDLVSGLRATRARSSGVDALMKEFSLSSQEGVALMCLAEALLRVPDTATADRLIRDKLADGDWRAHIGHSPSLFVNAATWGLLITGRLVSTSSAEGLSSALTRLVARGGEPLIRKGMDLAMRMLGEQFVTGRDIDEALERGREHEKKGYRYSFDMLGEAAMTAADAERYFGDYEGAIEAIGVAAKSRGVVDGNGISVKLSALHPRYTWSQRERVLAELLPKLRTLCLQARRHDIGLNIDAEEADRLDISLDLLEALATDDALAGWSGLGFVVQAYQKRAPCVLDFVIDLARRSGQRMMVRLVKGAYWDAEIKRAQIDGLAGYPVYTRKVYTDVAYLACARKLLAARDLIYPQFATHNAHSLAAIFHLAAADGRAWQPGDYEFQCLHGMGEPLYDQIVGKPGRHRMVRIYAPVGSHETLLAYLVRRLLENGANTSFVNRIVDERVPVEELIADPVEQAAPLAGAPHPKIALPAELFGGLRTNSSGHDLASEAVRARIAAALVASAVTPFAAGPIVAGSTSVPAVVIPVSNPANRSEIVGGVADASTADIERALAAASAAAPDWAATPAGTRSDVLIHAAALFEREADTLLALAVREAGKSWANAVAELREAVDFLRYYAQQARGFDPASHVALGPVLCISPWNFPLAIFTGQVAAALAAGNPVLAKPAEQTPLIAAFAVRLLHAAGIPPAALQLLPGRGETVGATLVADARVRGVMFTGSTEVAALINRTLAARGGNVPLIAETGGQNAMIVDSTALPEQVVTDVLASAFDSAGQRCSALRVLCLQEDIADGVLHMLQGALTELRLGNPADVRVDIGPVIDSDARDGLEAHVAAMQAKGARVTRLALPAECVHGTFVAPTIIEIGALSALGREQFGPILHVLRYRASELDGLINAINASGYGLTMGVHTRIDETVERVAARAHVGNLYVNRNIIGAAVGVQPFGGEGLSGTGPKAGGPLYLHRLLARTPGPMLADGAVAVAESDETRAADAALDAFLAWLDGAGRSLVEGDEIAVLRDRADACRARRLGGLRLALPGPTGEDDSLRFTARGTIAGVADSAAGVLHQVMAALASGNRLVLADSPAAIKVQAALPEALRARVAVDSAWLDKALGAVLFDGSDAEADALRVRVAARSGPVLQLLQPCPDYDLSRLVHERTLSINTAAAGGNASLMAMGA
ncbi:trifunctional transcriptional regulator/proline dehydrogenase/L-glutamate gamma-semialdehyde dehydrogenase [Thauera sp.]|uniref:trifunctional transcriptional regulator/proline dehydrogenase/L-glutamate gamma-semialdehyde dehydrogenase n=1 Tax=Thauera sp. TaxID=1905334 RepID=UPI002A35DE5A|nr:trifunctional transcriptional regulator/proline dehydrogenase/L-glutamate gamma-semialdehyde dehydrogenase [Thauera sp.]MDX9884715.1 trifunctional transcriptional regulator/proline dehydrogenase/L-glutamate gamma-semialdehyde dehydrogenase [Thauera sp.]